MPRRKKAPVQPHVEKSLQYARAVVSGDIYACKWVRLACGRQLSDLEKQADPSWPYVFRGDLAERACDFLEELPHTQGPLAFRREDGTWNRLVLEPWQCFIVCAVYGWIRKDSPKRRPIRRFVRVYEEEPRGQGKSLRLSGALLYSFAEGEQGVEAFSAAVDRAQAGKVYGEARAMLEKRPDLAATLGLRMSAHAIYQTSTHSSATALSRDAKKSGDGMNVAFASLDELHAHPTREIYDVLDTGTGKRGGNALVWAITTAGFDSSGICFEKRDYTCKVLEGSVTDDSWFGIIFTIDDPEAWPDEECRAACADHTHPRCLWRAANPNWGVSVDPVDFAAKMQRALTVASERNSILTKHLCLWQNADTSWVNIDAWDRAADPQLGELQFAGEPCIVGIDLASKVDIVAKVKVFVRDLPVRDGAGAAVLEENGEPKTVRHAYAFWTCWLPAAAITDSRNASYKGWAATGQLLTMPGEVVDDGPIIKAVKDDRGQHVVTEVAHDEWGARQLSNVLTADGFTMVGIRQNVQSFSEVMKELEAMLLSGRFHHNAGQCVRWQISNVVAHRDRNDNLFPAKLRPENKIDAAIALLMALNRALLAPPGPGPSVYEERERAQQPMFHTFG